ncbi:MAG: hypothetical protein ACLF0P_16280 [Thermoanaerobaculia bacterium]
MSVARSIPPTIPPGSAVIVNLTGPSEKYWGILGEIGVAGVVLRGIGVQSFDDWTAQAARGEEPTLDLATMFVPLFRIERIFLDEAVGEVESYSQRFQKRVGRPVEEFLGVAGDDTGEVPS